MLAALGLASVLVWGATKLGHLQPLVVISVGGRGKPGLVYPVDEAALKHGAGVSQETTDGDEAYAGMSEVVRTRYVEGELPF